MDEQLMRQGVFSWCELMTTDVAAAKEFYSKLFGWHMDDMQIPGMSYTILHAAGREVGGIMAIPADAAGMPPMWGTYVTVDNVDATARQAQALGGQVLVPPRDIPEVGRFCVIRDPQGAVISAITYLHR